MFTDPDKRFTKFFILNRDVKGCSFLENLEVHCWFNGYRSVKIEKIIAKSFFVERFQIDLPIEQDITAEVQANKEGYEKLKDDLEEWFSGEESDALARSSRDYEPDDDWAA